MTGTTKLDPRLRPALPDLFDLLTQVMPPKSRVYELIASHYGVTASLIQTYTLAERKKRNQTDE